MVEMLQFADVVYSIIYGGVIWYRISAAQYNILHEKNQKKKIGGPASNVLFSIVQTILKAFCKLLYSSCSETLF